MGTRSFDTVSRKIFTEKPRKYRLDEQTVKWIKSLAEWPGPWSADWSGRSNWRPAA